MLRRTTKLHRFVHIGQYTGTPLPDMNRVYSRRFFFEAASGTNSHKFVQNRQTVYRPCTEEILYNSQM